MEQILTVKSFGNERLALTENDQKISCEYCLKHGERCLTLKKVYFNQISPQAKREKIYNSDGSIMRTCGNYYISTMPKDGIGYFDIYDKGFVLKGEMEKYKISKIINFFRKDLEHSERKNIVFVNNKGWEKYVRTAMEDILKKASEGKLELQNLSKVMLEKCLQVIPKEV